MKIFHELERHKCVKISEPNKLEKLGSINMTTVTNWSLGEGLRLRESSSSYKWRRGRPYKWVHIK